MTAPRTDPQSTVPVEPLSADQRTCRHRDVAGDDASLSGWHCVRCGLVFVSIDLARRMVEDFAARASQPITATALDNLRDEIAALAYELTRSPNGPSEFRGEIGSVIARWLAALPVREDEPTPSAPDQRLRRAAARYLRAERGLDVNRHARNKDNWLIERGDAREQLEAALSEAGPRSPEPTWRAASQAIIAEAEAAGVTPDGDPLPAGPGWLHPEACVDLHDDQHNCLDPESGAIIGWREAVVSEPTLDMERLAEILAGYRTSDGRYIPPLTGDPIRLMGPREFARDIAARLRGPA